MGAPALLVLLFVVVAGATGSWAVSAPVADSPPVGISADYYFSVRCSEQGVPAGGVCSQSGAPLQYPSPAAHPDAFAQAAAALSSPPGSSVEVWFYNAACAASPAIQFLVTSRAKTVKVGEIPSAPAFHWASRPLVFAMPNVGQVRSGTGYQGAGFAFSFTGQLAACETGYSVFRGYFGVRARTGAPPPVSPCGTQAAVRRTADVVSGAGTTGCPLDVAVSGDKSLTSGLAFDGVSPTFVEGDKCLSGCTDLLVTVTDPADHGRPVAGATVTASVTPIRDRRVDPAATGYVCDGTNPTRCGVGRYLTGLRTDAGGHVRLRYWAPGLLTKLGTTLTVKAHESCSAAACRAGGKTGEADPTLTVSPNLIYDHPARLPVEEAKLLSEWTGSGPAVTGALNGAETLYDLWLNKLVKAEKLEEDLAEHKSAGLERISGVIEFAELAHAVKEQFGFMAFFLDAFNLSSIGLGQPAFERVATGAPSSKFIRAFAGDGYPPLHLGPKGLLWRYGVNLGLVERRDELKSNQFLHLYVYEVSSCKQGLRCGPGYLGNPGIETRLYLVFDSAASDVSGSFRQGILVAPYDAHAWMDTQPGIKVR